MTNPLDCAVCIEIPGGGGSGFMVLPDMVLTCFHVVQPLIHDARAGMGSDWVMRRLKEVRIHTQGPLQQQVRSLALGPPRQPGSALPDRFAPWLLRPGDPSLWEAAVVPGADFGDCTPKGHDFAFLRLAPMIRDPNRLFCPLPGLRVDPALQLPHAFTIRHYPQTAPKNPYVTNAETTGWITAYRNNPKFIDTDGQEVEQKTGRNRLFYANPDAMAPGSSGAAVIATPGGDARPFVIGLHAEGNGNMGFAVAVRDILDRVYAGNPTFHGLLTERNRDWALWRPDAWRLAQPVAKHAMCLLDRQQQASLICEGRLAPPEGSLALRIDALHQTPGAEADKLIKRLICHDLPISTRKGDAQALRDDMVAALQSRTEDTDWLSSTTWKIEGLGSFPNEIAQDDTQAAEFSAEAQGAALIEHLPPVPQELWHKVKRTLARLDIMLGEGTVALHRAFLERFLATLRDEKTASALRRGWIHLALVLVAPTDPGPEAQERAKANLDAIKDILHKNVITCHQLGPLAWGHVAPSVALMAKALSQPPFAEDEPPQGLAVDKRQPMAQVRQVLFPHVVEWAMSEALDELLQFAPQGDPA